MAVHTSSFWGTDEGLALRQVAADHAALPDHGISMVVGVRSGEGPSAVTYLIEVDPTTYTTGDPRFRTFAFTLRPGQELPVSCEPIQVRIAITHPDDLSLALEWGKSGLREVMRGADAGLLHPSAQGQLSDQLRCLYAALQDLRDG